MRKPAVTCLDYYNDKCNSLTHMCEDCPDRKEMRMNMLTFERLRAANVQRNKDWDPENQIGALFRGLEFSGEVGETIEKAFEIIIDLAKKSGKLTNVVKKLERERMGLVGSRVSLFELAQELADVQITLDLLAMHYSIDLGEAVCLKFNASSHKHGFKTKL